MPCTIPDYYVLLCRNDMLTKSSSKVSGLNATRLIEKDVIVEGCFTPVCSLFSLTLSPAKVRSPLSCLIVKTIVAGQFDIFAGPNSFYIFVIQAGLSPCTSIRFVLFMCCSREKLGEYVTLPDTQCWREEEQTYRRRVYQIWLPVWALAAVGVALLVLNNVSSNSVYPVCVEPLIDSLTVSPRKMTIAYQWRFVVAVVAVQVCRRLKGKSVQQGTIRNVRMTRNNQHSLVAQRESDSQQRNRDSATIEVGYRVGSFLCYF